jgi:hypothetical protein
MDFQDISGKRSLRRLSKDLLASYPITGMDPEDRVGAVDEVRSQEDEAEVINRLEDLGYL